MKHLICYRCQQPWEKGSCGCVDGCCVIWGDCREALPLLPKGSVDLVLTDPPYGINYTHSADRSVWASKHNEIPIIGDDKPFDPRPLLTFPEVILWGANHYADRLPPSKGWIIWDKRCNTAQNDQSDCEIAWTTLLQTARIFYHMWMGFAKDSEQGIARVHPTQKPIALMRWCLGLAGMAQTVLDPYLGSGTTAVACKMLGRKCVGIEISEEYVRIACRRLDATTPPLLQAINTKSESEQLRMECK